MGAGREGSGSVQQFLSGAPVADHSERPDTRSPLHPVGPTSADCQTSSHALRSRHRFEVSPRRRGCRGRWGPKGACAHELSTLLPEREQVRSIGPAGRDLSKVRRVSKPAQIVDTGVRMVTHQRSLAVGHRCRAHPSSLHHQPTALPLHGRSARAFGASRPTPCAA